MCRSYLRRYGKAPASQSLLDSLALEGSALRRPRPAPAQTPPALPAAPVKEHEEPVLASHVLFDALALTSTRATTTTRPHTATAPKTRSRCRGGVAQKKGLGKKSELVGVLKLFAPPHQTACEDDTTDDASSCSTASTSARG
mmetsp:Transcript_85171/g.198030  ORF Transcript_85171/g.198030 Transcript_85171/m.198030 type:complete len:142 (-) Transcript_85171:56-481(-)